ncbi:MAG TPA: alpha/beta fold hydrolase [Kofleriaceae bacterium]|jgi:pimeloyl-ACP methyl ester carboxylesterase
MLSFQAHGAGDAVLLVHSGGLGGRQWRRLAADLATTHRAIVPELVGYGDSPPLAPGEPFDFTRDVAELLSVVDAVAPAGAPLRLVGHSYGGLLAAHVALARPAQIRALALYEPVIFAMLDRRDELSGIRTTWEPDASGVDEAWLAAFVAWWNGPGAWSTLAEDVRASFRRVGWKLFREVISLSADPTPAARFASIAAPTLLMGGALTPALEQRVLQTLAARLPHATLTMLDGAGHMGPITHAATVNAAFAAFIRAN